MLLYVNSPYKALFSQEFSLEFSIAIYFYGTYFLSFFLSSDNYDKLPAAAIVGLGR